MWLRDSPPTWFWGPSCGLETPGAARSMLGEVPIELEASGLPQAPTSTQTWRHHHQQLVSLWSPLHAPAMLTRPVPMAQVPF